MSTFDDCRASDVSAGRDAIAGVLTPLTETIRYRDAHGFLQEVRVTSTLARAIRNVRQQARRADERWRERHRAMTDLGIEPDRVETKPVARPSQAGNPWQGPRFSFMAWIGEGRIWPGPPRPRARTCDFCKGAWLGVGTYCLRCDRSGRDRELPRPSRTELSRIRSPKDDGLKGGK